MIRLLMQLSMFEVQLNKLEFYSKNLLQKEKKTT